MGFFYAAVATISFEIFLVVQVGFNIKAPHLLLAISICFACILIADRGRLRLPLGIVPLCLWTLFILAFIPNTTFLARNVGYALWLVFSVMMIVAFVQVFNTYSSAQALARFYLYTFAGVGLFGLAQFSLAVSGIASPLITQWWIPNILPRINGFSYEPSYYATYLIMGWVMAIYLLEKRAPLIPTRRLKWILIILTLAILASTSRMGIAIIVLYMTKFPYLFLKRLLKGKINTLYLKTSLLLTIFAMGITVALVSYPFLLNGLGIGTTAGHSTQGRLSAAIEVLSAFSRSPIIGYSLGGIPSAIGRGRGIVVTSFEQAKSLEGQNVFTEVLAASGLIGIIPFITYIILVIWKPLELSTRIREHSDSTLLRSLVYSFLAVLLILQFNQNILRLYFWLHLAILSVVYGTTKSDLLRQSEDEQLTPLMPHS